MYMVLLRAVSAKDGYIFDSGNNSADKTKAISNNVGLKVRRLD